jgi:hypothetical protein
MLLLVLGVSITEALASPFASFEEQAVYTIDKILSVG